MSEVKYIAFIDETGIASLNDTQSQFLLSMVIIDKKDFEIIEGYLRLIKRRFLNDDFKTLHATDLFDNTARAYPELNTTRKANEFINQLGNVLNAIPFYARVYFVDKDAVRARLSYVPAKGKKTSSVDPELPYEAAAKAAINNFTEFLIEKDAAGEIVIESRLFNDSCFVNAFDSVRKRVAPGNVSQPLYGEIIKRINSLLIASKNRQDGGLELADLCAYATIRNRLGNSNSSTLVSYTKIQYLYTIIKNHAYKGANDSVKKLVYDVNP